MPIPGQRSDVRLDVEAGASKGRPRPRDDAPFLIAVLGDFSGRASRGEKRGGAEIDGAGVRRIDRDNVDEIMERLGVELETPVAGRIGFRSLDDFHPDSLYERLDLFREIERAGVPDGEAEPLPAPTPARPTTERPPDLGLGGLLDQAVEKTSSQAEGRVVETRDSLRRWLDEKVAPHTEAAPDPREAGAEDRVRQAVNAQMRAVIHDPAFQALEAAWRAVDLLVRRTDTGETLKIFLIDVTKEELSDDLRAADHLADTGLVRLLEPRHETDGWALLVGNYSFGPEVDDIALLARLGRIGQALNAPFVAGADPRLAGTDSLTRRPDPRDWAEPPETWRALRKHPASSSIGLALPRFLLRLPYGAGTSPCDGLLFEEQETPPEHEQYLWGNAAVLCACLLGESFAEAGWGMRPGMHQNIGRLPFHVFKDDGETRGQPCAEITMSERMAGVLAQRGLMTAASIRDSDEIRLVRFQSIADGGSGLAGRWG